MTKLFAIRNACSDVIFEGQTIQQEIALFRKVKS